MHVNSLSFRYLNVEWAVRNALAHDFKSNRIVYPLVSTLIYVHCAFILRDWVKKSYYYRIIAEYFIFFLDYII